MKKILYALDVLAHVMEVKVGDLPSSLPIWKGRFRIKVFQHRGLELDTRFVRGQFIISVALSPSQWPSALKDIQDEIGGFKKTL